MKPSRRPITAARIDFNFADDKISSKGLKRVYGLSTALQGQITILDEHTIAKMTGRGIPVPTTHGGIQAPVTRPGYPRELRKNKKQLKRQTKNLRYSDDNLNIAYIYARARDPLTGSSTEATIDNKVTQRFLLNAVPPFFVPQGTNGAERGEIEK